jgi:lipopolysaccharide biosynthesis regulator YciM
MDTERMKKIILEIYTGQVNMQDAVDLTAEYMSETKGTVNQTLLQFMCNQTNPVSMQMLQRAVEVSKEYFENTRVIITKVLKADGTFMYAF